MTVTCENVREALSGFTFIKDCLTLSNGALRIATPFRYPDGSLIDIFMKDQAGPPEDKNSYIRGCVLSDYSQTMAYLADLHIRPRANPRRKQLLDDICESLGVEYRGGELQRWIDPRDMDKVTEGIIALIQACVRVADISFLSKFSIHPEFKEEVKKFIGGEGVDGPGVMLPGRWGRDVEVDFLVRRKKQSLLKTVSSGGAAASIHSPLAEVFCRWSDLKPIRPDDQLITVIDDKERITRQDDLARLKEISRVVSFPREKDMLHKLLSAA